MKLKAIFFALLANFSMIGAASAAIVTINYTGTVNALGNDFVSTTVQVGDQISGSFTFDDAATSTGSSGAGTIYPATDAELTLASLATFISSTGGDITVGDNIGGQDIFRLDADLDGTNGGRVRIEGRDSSDGSFSSQSLSEIVMLAQSGDLSAFDTLSLVLFVVGNGVWGECNGDCGIFASVDSFSLSQTPVPLPAALPLFIAGLAGIGAFGRRKKAVVA